MNVMQASAGQRERLAMSVERLNESGERITESRRTMMETEELGISILEDLHQQRETLLHSHKKVCFYWAFTFYPPLDSVIDVLLVRP